MTSEAPPPAFRFRHLLDPRYVARKRREIRSLADFLSRLKNLGRYGFGRAERLFYELRGALFPGYPGAAVPAAPVSASVRPEILARAEALAKEFASAKPFRHAVIDEFLVPAFCLRLSDEFPKSFYRREEIAKLGASYAELDRYFQSPEFLEFVSRITGIPGLLADPEYFDAGLSELLDGEEIDPHLDYTLHPRGGRSLRAVLSLSLNFEWGDSWGGALELHLDPRLPPGRNEVLAITPSFNRCVILETGERSWHGVETVKLPPEKKVRSRRAITISLYTRDDPRGILPIPSDLSVFAARPLPPEIKPGRVLTEEDMNLISRRIADRDWKLEYLYGRAIGLFNQWRAVKAELESSGDRGAKSPPAGSAEPRGGS